MSARVVAVTQLLLDLLDDIGPKQATAVTPSEFDLAMLFIPLAAELQILRDQARAEMGAAVVRVLGT